MTSPGGIRTRVAVKLLHAELDPESQPMERLRDEGRLLGLLDHPHILSVIDLCQLGERVALITEYIEGADLKQCIRGAERMPARCVVEVVGRVAEALEAAWSTVGDDGEPLHIVHRDVKPANIRIGRRGEVKLLDFGIARAALRPSRTGTDVILGSFGFLAPERFEPGRPVTPPSDVFSLGCVLFEGMVGAGVFAGLDHHEHLSLASDAYPYDRWLARRFEALTSTPPAIAALVRELLSFDPAARPTAAEVARRCEALAETLDGPVLRKWCRDRPWPDVVPAGATLDRRVLVEGAEPVELPASGSGPVSGSGSIEVQRSGRWRLAGLIGMGMTTLGAAGAAGRGARAGRGRAGHRPGPPRSADRTRRGSRRGACPQAPRGGAGSRAPGPGGGAGGGARARAASCVAGSRAGEPAAQRGPGVPATRSAVAPAAGQSVAARLGPGGAPPGRRGAGARLGSGGQLGGLGRLRSRLRPLPRARAGRGRLGRGAVQPDHLHVQGGAMILWLATSALGADTCVAWPAAQLARWDVDAREALQEEDVERFSAGWTELQAVFPCVTGVVDAGTWARYLVALAIYEYAAGAKWTEPIDTALATWPEVPRDLGPPDIRDREAPAPDDVAEPLPGGAEWFVDGRPVSSLPSLAGLHLLQRRVGVDVQTRLVRNGVFPSEWAAPVSTPVVVPRAPAAHVRPAWGFAAVGGGFGGRGQVVSEQNTHVRELQASAPVVAVVSRGTLPAAGAVVLGWDLDAAMQVGAGPALDGYALVGGRLGPVVVAGGGGATTGVVTVDDAARTVVLPQPHAAVRLGAGPAAAQVAGGWTPAAWHAGASLAAQSSRTAGATVALGLLAHQSRFDEEGGDLSLSHLRWTTTLAVGGAFGAP